MLIVKLQCTANDQYNCERLGQVIKVFEAKTLGKWIDDQELLLVLVVSISRATQCSCMMMAGYKHPAHRLTPNKTSQGNVAHPLFQQSHEKY